MWYVLRAMTGKENILALWINAYMDKNIYSRCFVPLYEEVRRHKGIGEIRIRRLFNGYVFIESEQPKAVYQELRKMQVCWGLMFENPERERELLPINIEEERLLDDILSEGLLRVSYIRSKNRKLEELIGPLERYWDDVELLDIQQRKAKVKLQLCGEEKWIRFGLWTDKDPKIAWIEEEKKRRAEARESEIQKSKQAEAENCQYKPGDMVINITGLFGDDPLEVAEVHHDQGTLTVKADLFGQETRLEMKVEDVVKVG